MDYSYGYMAAAQAFSGVAIITCLLGIVAIVMYFILINKLVKVVRSKGYGNDEEPSWMLWLIGIFLTPIALGIYTIALRDKNPRLGE